jgi:hypothetical protein
MSQNSIVTNLSTYKDEKEGKITPSMVLEEAHAEVECGVKFALFASVNDDGSIYFNFSDVNVLEVLGMLEAIKHNIYENL